MTPHEVLVAARELIADERNWIKGRARSVRSGRICRCTYGAVVEIAKDGSDEFKAAWPYLDDLHEFGAITYNDAESTTHADVLAMFDKAIEATAGSAA